MFLSSIIRPSPRTLTQPLRHAIRTFTTAPITAVQLPPRPTIKESDIEESFLKGSGPGGQKINKTSSAVQLKHLPSGMVVKSQATRSRTQNRKIARRLLAEKLEVVEKGPESRVAMKGEVKRKKKASKRKKAKRKYRGLGELEGGAGVAEGKVGDGEEEGGDEAEDEEGDGEDDDTSDDAKR